MAAVCGQSLCVMPGHCITCCLYHSVDCIDVLRLQRHARSAVYSPLVLYMCLTYLSVISVIIKHRILDV